MPAPQRRRPPPSTPAARLRCAVCAVALAAAACAGNQERQIDPEAGACVEPPPRIGSPDFDARRAALAARAERFGTCMRERGFALDEARLEQALERFEQVKNADPYGGDPWQAVALRKEELRASPHMWRREATQ